MKKAFSLSALALSALVVLGQMMPVQACDGKCTKKPAPTTPAPAPSTPAQ